MSKISVIVVNGKGRDIYKASLSTRDYPNYEAIVTDNGRRVVQIEN